MKRLTMLITSDGQWVLEDSVEFLTALGDPNPDYDAASFAVKNLGFIKFQVLDSSIVEIELQVADVCCTAASGVAAERVAKSAPTAANLHNSSIIPLSPRKEKARPETVIDSK